LGDYAWDADHLTGQNYAPLIYRSIWVFSTCLSVLCLPLRKSASLLPVRFDLNSISVFSKLTCFGVSLSSLLLSRFLGGGEIWNIKSISFTLVSGILVSGLFGQYTFDKLRAFSQSFLDLFSDNLDTQMKNLEQTEGTKLPSELSILFAHSAQRILKETKEKRDHFVRLEIEKEQIKSAALLAHNLRSPIATLNVLTQISSRFSEEEKLLLSSATTRIREIVDGILTQYKAIDSIEKLKLNRPTQFHTIYPLIQQSIESKKMEFISQNNIHFDFHSTTQCHQIRSLINDAELLQVFSNIFNNSIESMGDSGGKIWVTLDQDNDHCIRISVSDTGTGISNDIIPLLGTSPLSFGKHHGCGFGLKHAYQVIQEWKGRIQIENILPRGTRVSIRLPAEPSI
jgi:signal transduction histidine kinase